MLRTLSKEDLCEVWENIRSGNNVMLWCDGMRSSKTTTTGSRKRPLNADSEDETQCIEGGKKGKSAKRKKKQEEKEEKEERVENIRTSLKEKHGSSFTPMQYRIWAEMIAGGVHCSYDDHPNSSMFLRVGVGTKKKTPSVNVLSEAITQLSSALSPKPVATTSSGSPAKIIENRSKCYKQLAELKNLVELGVLSEEECDAERNAILGILKTYR